MHSADRNAFRAVVITGAGRAFSAGGDMKFLSDRTESDALSNANTMKSFYDRFLCLRSLEVPTIAAINGPAIGAGLCVAAACDMRICAADAKMGWTFVGLGLHPGMVSFILGSGLMLTAFRADLSARCRAVTRRTSCSSQRPWMHDRLLTCACKSDGVTNSRLLTWA